MTRKSSIEIYPQKLLCEAVGTGNFGGKKLLFKRVNLLCREGFSKFNI
jgi:hypothetical protein